MRNPISTIKNKRILFSPLNWGMGHVTRSIPVIEELLTLGNEVIICCNTSQETMYRDYFPSLWYISHEGYEFEFRGKGEFEKDLLRTYSSLNNRLKKELKEVAGYVKTFKPDLIISDQRFGFYSADIRSIIISHQTKLPLKGLFRVAQLQNFWKLKRFDEVWIPDDEEINLSGKLSKSWLPKKYIGIKSRLKKENFKEEKYKYVAIVTGPTPYGEQFFELIKKKFSALEYPTLIIASKHVATSSLRQMGNCEVIVQPGFETLQKVLGESSCVISRSGYSTLLDLAVLDKKAILIPTAGQKEQVYLAQHNAQKEQWLFKTEEEFEKMDLSLF